MSQEYLQELRVGLNQLVGKKCWGITGGGAAGSVISLSIGDKVLRKNPLKNPQLREDQRIYDSETALMIDCSWRLESIDGVLTSWVDDSTADGPMLSILQKIEGETIEEVNLSLPGLDLSLCFSNMLVLKVFCDRIREEEDTDNYVLFTPQWNYTVCVRSKIEREPRHVY